MFARLIRSSSRRDFDCSNCARARSSCATRRLVPRLGVVEGLAGQQLALEQAAVPLEVGLRELEVRFALPDRRFGDLERRFRLPDLLLDLAVLDLGDRLAAPDASRRGGRARTAAVR